MGDAEIKLQAQGGAIRLQLKRARHGEQQMKPADRRQRKKRRELHVPMHCTRDFPLSGTFPLKDMRSQNLAKWPLGNYKALL